LSTSNSEDSDNIGLYQTTGVGVGLNVGAQVGAGVDLTKGGIAGDSWELDINGEVWGPTLSVPAAGDITLQGIAFQVGPGEGVSGSHTRTDPVFTLNNLKGMVYRFMFEGRLSDD